MAQFRLPENQGTSTGEAITGGSSNIYFGLGGNDTLTAAAGTGGSTYLGGSGDDRYVVTTGAAMNIDDAGSGTDTVVMSGVNSASVTYRMVNNVHLLIQDSVTFTTAFLCYAATTADKIESIQFSDTTISMDTLLAGLSTNSKYLGNTTLAALGALPANTSEAELTEAIDFYKARALSLESTGTTPVAGAATTGNDVLIGTSAPDSISGLEGNDTITGNEGNDTILGNQGLDSIEGGTGDDLIRAGRDNDFAQGNQGADTVAGDLGDDLVRGGQDNDSVYGGQGNDRVAGDLGDDNVFGDLGDDTIYGGQGNDTLTGGAGNDYIYGDKGNDNLTGGDGADVFVFATLSGYDAITDFVHGVDHIQISAAMLAANSVEFANGILYFTGTDLVSIPAMTAFDLSDFIIV